MTNTCSPLDSTTSTHTAFLPGQDSALSLFQFLNAAQVNYPDPAFSQLHAGTIACQVQTAVTSRSIGRRGRLPQTSYSALSPIAAKVLHLPPALRGHCSSRSRVIEEADLLHTPELRLTFAPTIPPTSFFLLSFDLNFSSLISRIATRLPSAR